MAMNREIGTNPVIEQLYRNHMWVSDLHYRALYRFINEENWTEEQLKAAIEEQTPAAKRAFIKVFQRMGNKAAYYRVPNGIFPVGEEATVNITCKYKFQRLVGKYKVVISPYYNYDFRAAKQFEPYAVTIEAKDDCLSIPYIFENEDMYGISVFYLMDGQEMLLLSTSVYALDRDLYECDYFKADLHMHTTYSDGYEPPELVALSAREQGMDIIAVTDHNGFYGSVEAREKAMRMGLDMTVILGEEYSLEYSPMHILALGTQEPIDRRYLTRQVLSMPETRRIIQETADISCDVEAYACTQVLLDEVSRLGGISILAHPYWKPIAYSGTRMDTPENLFIELGKNRRFAGIELVSGSQDGEFNVSNLQASLARTILGTFDGFPVIGITDSHSYTTDHISGKHYTIVFARSKEEGDVLEALRCGRCVAVEMAKGVPLCYGSHRLVKVAEFLIRRYFPERDDAAREETRRIKKEKLLRL